MQRPVQGDCQCIKHTSLAKCPSLTEVHGNSKIGHVNDSANACNNRAETRL